MPLRLHNSLTRRVEPLTPIDPANVTFYSCGPTVYDDAHIGNFRSFLAADVLRRWIESPLCEVTAADGAAIPGPRRVTHVMNITDVGHMTDDSGESGEDRMAVAGRRLAEAKKAGKLPAGVSVDAGDPYAIAEFYAQRFLEDARLLGLKVAVEALKDPTLMPRPTQKIAPMIAMVQTLIRRGHAYAVGPAGAQAVYFDVQSFPAYGRLSGNTLERLRTGAGGRVSEGNQSQKRHPADFLLWKADPAHVMKWPSPWGEGYPGWHLECSVMAAERLASPEGEIDLHSGGEDNIFPHHECELAQTCAATGHPVFARMWFHPRHLFVEGDKMSKSKGNFYTVRDLIARGLDPAAIRLELIRTHYRSNADFSIQRAVQTGQQLVDWAEGAAMLYKSIDLLWKQPPARKLQRLDSFAAAMNDDLNVAKALSILHSFFGGADAPAVQAMDALEACGWDLSSRGAVLGWLSEMPTSPMPAIEATQQLNRGRAEGTFREAWAALNLMDAVFGVVFAPRAAAVQTDIGVFLDGEVPDPAVVAKLHERAAARAAKDFRRSDAIRDELAKMGYTIKDVAGGKVEVRRA